MAIELPAFFVVVIFVGVVSNESSDCRALFGDDVEFCLLGVVDDVDTFVDEEDIVVVEVSQQLFSHCISIYFGFAWHSPRRAHDLQFSLLSLKSSYLNENVEFSVDIVSQTLQLFSH